MAKLRNEFKIFYNDEVKYYANKEIRDKKEDLKSEFKSNFPGKFKDYYGDDLTSSSIRFINQGSYAIGTTINHGNTAFDIDVATIIELDVNKYMNPVEIKKIARDALSYRHRTVIIKKPCITVKYSKAGEEKYHIDFPIYANWDGKLYLSRGNEFSSEENRFWEEADPEGLNCYFSTENLQIDGLNLNNEEIEKRNQKRRVIRYIKWWKAEKYSVAMSKNEVPPSIALTVLMCKYFQHSKIDGEYNDLDALYKSTKKLIDAIFFDDINDKGDLVKKIHECNLPRSPYTDCFSKLNSSDNHILKFYNRLDYFRSQLEYAVLENDERKAGEAICKVLGDKFPLPEKDRANEQDSFAK